MGAIGAGIDPRIIRCLAILNESRGKDAVGFFNSHGAFWKHAERATVELRDRKATQWLEDSAKKTWALCGHTRAGTRGGATTRNAHPFLYGRVIGSHNGTIGDAPKEYAVDTEWAIDLLSRANPGAYQTALGEVAGWYVLTWLDQRTRSIYLLNWEGTLHITHFKGVWYYSSEADHLRTAIGAETKIAPITHGKVVRFWWHKKDGLQHEALPDFNGKRRYPQNVQSTCHGGRQCREYDDGIDASRAIPLLGGPSQVRSTRPKNTDPLTPSGFIVKFPNGFWYAQLLNKKYRIMRSQKELIDLYKDAKTDDFRFMRPGEIRTNLTPISPVSPITNLPEGMKGPPDVLATAAPLVQASGAVTAAEKKSNPQTAGTSFPTEEDQERADLDAAKAASMDRDGAVIERVVQLQQDRFSFLTEDLDLTQDEATRVMTYEGYFSPAVN